MRLFLDSHGELLQIVAVEPRLAQHTSKLTSKSTLVCVSGEEGDRLSALSSAPWIDLIRVEF